MKEIWKECLDGWYEVSNLGRVRRAKPGHGTWPGRILKQSQNHYGYPSIGAKPNGKSVRCTVHQLVAGAFLPDKPDGHAVNHIDGIKTNNRADNLEWTTPSGNLAHAYKTGLRQPVVKYDEATIKRVRELSSEGLSTRSIAKATGISMRYCYCILSGQARSVNWDARMSSRPREQV